MKFKVLARATARRLLTSVALSALCATSALADSEEYKTPDTSNPTTVLFGGQTFINHGLVGAGRSSSSTLDFNGHTLGSFSGMAVVQNTWRRTGSGYTGQFYTLPDRGYNNGDIFSDYAARLHEWTFDFTPYTGVADLPQVPGSQNQVIMTPTGGFNFRDFNGQLTTGNNPEGNTVVQDGHTLPAPALGKLGAGKISMDNEAVTFLSDGSFYVGDEYTAGVYYFDAAGNMIGYLEPETALLPKAGGTTNFGANLNTTGRRTNQGMEGISVSPDGKWLFAVLQSATLQDGAGGQETRNNTRVFVYDISTNRTPANPVGHYVLQLPVFDRDGTNGANDRTAAQSEVLALNSNQFLLLTRDGNGLGVEDNRPLMFKSIYLVDIAGATNLSGTAYETGTDSVVDSFGSKGGVLEPGIVPVQSTKLVNLINPAQLNKLGFTTAVTPLNPASSSVRISEKWEAMALLPVLEEDAPQDFFLFVGNDNDFATNAGCVMPGVANCNGPLANDNVMMVWRLTLPTYVDSVYLESMIGSAPYVIAATGANAMELAPGNARAIGGHFDNTRYATLGMAQPAQGAGGFDIWAEGNVSFLDDSSTASGEGRAGGIVIGGDAALMPGFRLGLAGGYHLATTDEESDVDFRGDAWEFSAFAGYSMAGLYLNGSYTYGELDVDRIARPAGYGLIAEGNTEGSLHTFRGEAGYLFPLDGFHLGPVAGAEWVKTEIDGYTETGAAGGNVVYPSTESDNWLGFVGAEASLPVSDAIRLTGRGVYNFVDEGELTSTIVSLASAAHAMGTQTVTVPDYSQDSVGLSLSATGLAEMNSMWHVSYGAQIGIDNGVTHRVSVGINVPM